jgi:heme a synthase
MLRTMAIACVVLVLAITTLSAFIRLSRPATDCEPWPQCRSAQLRPSTQEPASSGAIGVARIAHRIAASAALLLIIGMLMVSYASQPVLREPGRLVLALLGLALFLAVLGRMGADSRAAAVVLGNLLAGFALFAVSCRLVTLLVSRARRGASLPAGWVWAALVLLVAQTALGAVVSALGDSGGPAPLVHQLASVLLAAVLLPLGYLAWRRGHRAGAAVMVLVLLELAGGGLLVVSPQSLGLALAHNVLGALLVAAVANLAAGAAAN